MGEDGDALLPMLSWLYDSLRRREQQLPGAFIDCGARSPWDVAKRLNGFSSGGMGCGRDGPTVRGNGSRPWCAAERRPPLVVAVSLEPVTSRLAATRRLVLASRRSAGLGLAWRAVHGQLADPDEAELLEPAVAKGSTPTGGTDGLERPPGISLKGALRIAAAASAPHRLEPSIFLLRAGPRCRLWAAVGAALGPVDSAAGTEGTEGAAPPIKFLWLTGRSAGRRRSQEGHSAPNLSRMQAAAGEADNKVGGEGGSAAGCGGLGHVSELLARRADWLCFCILRQGRLKPTFSPFEDAARGVGGLFCGHEHDTDLDTVVRLLSGGALLAGPPPARWGAYLEGHGSTEVERRNVLASARGRFLYAAAKAA